MENFVIFIIGVRTGAAETANAAPGLSLRVSQLVYIYWIMGLGKIIFPQMTAIVNKKNYKYCFFILVKY